MKTRDLIGNCKVVYTPPITKVVEINSYGTMLLEPSKYNGFEGEEEEL